MITTVGLFAIFQLEFNLTTLAAILTIAGYSINDTVVIYDRVRESMRKYRTMPFRDLINLALNETLSRTILTVSTVALAVLSLLVFGGEVLEGVQHRDAVGHRDRHLFLAVHRCAARSTTSSRTGARSPGVRKRTSHGRRGARVALSQKEPGGWS